MNGDVKAGFLTSEFWLVVLKLLVGAALIVLGYEAPGLFLIGGGAQETAGYSRGRQELKIGAMKTP